VLIPSGKVALQLLKETWPEWCSGSVDAETRRRRRKRGTSGGMDQER
jgi:hypothetical protein